MLSNIRSDIRDPIRIWIADSDAAANQRRVCWPRSMLSQQKKTSEAMHSLLILHVSHSMCKL